MDTKPNLKPKTKTQRIPKRKPHHRILLHERHIGPMCTAEWARKIAKRLAQHGWRVTYYPHFDKAQWVFEGGQAQYTDFFDTLADVLAPLFAGEPAALYFSDEEDEEEEIDDEVAALLKTIAVSANV